MTGEIMNDESKMGEPKPAGMNYPKPQPPMEFPEQANPEMTYPSSPTPMSLPEQPPGGMLFPGEATQMDYPEPQKPMIYPDTPQWRGANRFKEVAPEKFHKLAEVLNNSESTGRELLESAQGANYPPGNLIEFLEQNGQKEKADEVRRVAKELGMKEEELLPLEDKDFGVTEEGKQDLQQNVEGKTDELTALYNTDEQQFAQELQGDPEKDDKIIKLQTLKTKTKPLLDKIMQIKESKGFKIGQYILLGLLISLVLSAFALLRVHTGMAGGGKGGR